MTLIFQALERAQRGPHLAVAANVAKDGGGKSEEERRHELSASQWCQNAGVTAGNLLSRETETTATSVRRST